MKFDFDLALQVFERMSKQDREAVLASVNFLMAVQNVKIIGGGKSKEVFGLLAVGGYNVQIEQGMEADILNFRFQVGRENLYGMNIREGKQTKLPLKTDIDFDNPAPRKPRLIL